MFDPTYPLFPIFAFVGFVLVLIPLPWHLHAWNSGTCFYMMWAALACLNQFVNSVVWANTALNLAPIWCDISIRIMMGASVGLPAASLCINRRLYYIASSQTVSISHSDKLRAILVDTLICVVFPLVYIALQYVVQGHRFNIFEGIGCYPALYNTLLTYFISGMWPVVIGLISAVYCTLSLRAFARRRVQFSQFLSSNNSSLTISRYFRLMGLAMADIVFTTPPAVFAMYLNATVTPVGPWRSWQDTHLDYSRVEQYPAILWRGDHMTVVALEFTRWVTPACALIFFGFFGFADEAKRNYRAAFWWLVKPFGYHPRTAIAKPLAPSIGKFVSKPIPSSDSSLPPYTPPSSTSLSLHEKKRTGSLTDSFACTTTNISILTSVYSDTSSYPPSPSTTVADGPDHHKISSPIINGSIV